MRTCALTVLALLIIAAGPQEKPSAPKGGLKPGDELPDPFQPYNVNGKFKGRFHCLVCQHGLNPVAAVFVRGTDNLESVGPLLQALETAVKDKKNEKARLAAFAVFVDEQLPDVVGNDDKREELAKKLDDLAGKLDRVTLSLESKANLEKYHLDPDADVTLLLYDKLKVVEVKPLAKAKLTKESVPALVSETVAKLVKK
jgi:hypothetical protein